MNDNYDSMVDTEIQRLVNKGWTDLSLIENGICISKEINESEISFPSESYEGHAENLEYSGVWESWRVKQIVEEMIKLNQKIIWEVGSGHGNVAIPLKKKNVCVIGIEPLISGARITAKSQIRTYVGTLESLKFPPNSISAIGIFDVLEHLENPQLLLSEIYRVLEPGGFLMILVPAHQWLFSDFDFSIGHIRRYSRKALKKSLNHAGFRTIKMRFLFSLLVIPALLLRKIPHLLGRNRQTKETLNSLDKQRRILKILRPILEIILLVEKIFHFPFGLSLFSVSRK
jgi:SAM-dependent methyltransferase